MQGHHYDPFMPDYREFSPADMQRGEQLRPEWTKLPFPQSWKELEVGVNQWLQVVWGPDWKCPHCGHRFWFVLEGVAFGSAQAWPIPDTSSLGSYPVVPVACAWCRQATPILLLSIFESPATEADNPEATP